MAEENINLEISINEFSWNLYKEISQPGSNVIISPYSVCCALMLAALGARGETENQILESVFPKYTSSNSAHLAFSLANKNLKNLVEESNGTLLVTIANKLFAKKNFNILEKYACDAKKFYDSGVELVDFDGAPDESRRNINKWVETVTHNKIKDLLQEGSVDANTVMVLVNSIYFKGKWTKPFKSEMTIQADFSISSSETAKVEMMREKFDMPYIRNDALKYSAVALSYEGPMSMIVVLPDAFGLNDLETSFKSFDMSQILADLRNGTKFKVDLGLPRFTFSETTDLSRVLQKLGINDLFDNSKVDLSGMSDTAKATISDVIHQAFIEVNEEGTEAAAATAMMSRMMILPTEEATFICDRPFLFLLVNIDNGTIVFIGRYTKP